VRPACSRASRSSSPTATRARSACRRARSSLRSLVTTR
jgi:hypothetical protein